MNHKIHKLLCLLLISFSHPCFSQYILNGSAEKVSCNCYTLTKEITTQSGSVWNSNKINLTTSFDFWFNVNLGCNDAGADGIVFILQPISTSVGSTGEGMGFGGVSPSIGIALDTYQNLNLNDPVFDHISIQANGVINHSNDLAGPVAISSTSNNVEDCQWHKLRITWDATTKWLRTYFDGVLRVEKQIDLVTTIFNNDPNVYWGFTGATGGSVNLQQFCTALDPIFTTNTSNNVACEGASITFTNASESFAPIVSYNWSFGDGTFSTAQNPTPHTYALPGSYVVNLKIIGLDGCERDSSKTIKIAANPYATLQAFDTCFKRLPRVIFTAPTADASYQWTLDATTSNTQPDLSLLSAGNHQLNLIVTSNYGCGQPAQATTNFTINPLPVADAVFDDGCLDELISFAGSQTDAQTTITKWNWKVDNSSFASQNFQRSFAQGGNYPVQLWVEASNGCISDTVQKSIRINSAVIIANDTNIIANRSTQLNVFANGNVTWQPSFGLSDATIVSPFATLPGNQKYLITVITPEGCIASDTMLVKVFKGPAIYVPTGFTPNGDGKNELLLPVYAGIKELKEFAVFNRWGQIMFHTNNMQKGWDGREATVGTYVWLVRAIDDTGKLLTLKGTFTLIK